ncbi:metallophosphatase [Flavobacteriaceae bacterium R38]|nr:metallophosphatase [Flavobacteriaceae bacterium R38]
MRPFKLKNILLGLCLLLMSLISYGQEIEKSIFITANTKDDINLNVLKDITTLSKNNNNATLLILGNVTTAFKKKDDHSLLTSQLKLIQDFNGDVFVSPGHSEWDFEGHRSIQNLEDFIQKNSKASYFPDEGCPIKVKDLSDNAVLISLDSQWFLENWNKHTYINDDCEIKNRTQFFLAFEGILKKNQGKVKIITSHHPVFSNTKKGFIARTGGTTTKDFQNKQNRAFRNQILTLARQTEEVVFVSGHDHNLQYINKFGIPQIISGANGKTKKARTIEDGDFASSENGFAKIDIYNNGRVIVHYYSSNRGNVQDMYSTTVFEGGKGTFNFNFKPENSLGVTQKSSVYSVEETTKSKFYKGLWGEHYRKFYSKEIEAPVALLDTLKGGLTPLRRGGGHQTKSLRLEDKNGKQYVMRALKKSAVKFLQATAFKDKYVEEELENSFADRFVLDFYTTAHPYTSLVVGDLADAVGVFHANPELYYIPKHEGLKEFNEDYGDELYLIEERVASNHSDLESFGKPEKIVSTNDVLAEIHRTGKSDVDEPLYLKARLFDMLIGDWDRHFDQWRWGLFKNADGTKAYKPIPRDRDQAFSVFDGSLFSFLRFAIPQARMFQSFDENLPNPRWFNVEPYPLDLTFLNQSTWKDWEREAKYLQDHLTDSKIEEAFENLPEEMKGETVEEIKAKLKGRRKNLVKIAREYYNFVARFEVITGTQKKDRFEITRMPDGDTKIEVHRKDLGIFSRVFNKKETKEIWIYGLDGKDEFKVAGKGDQLIKIRIIGGKNNDTYDFENIRNVKLYDYKSKENTIVNKRSHKWLVDDYDINTYDYTKRKHNINRLLPTLAFNPDDGVRIGITDTYKVFGLQGNPFSQQHTFNASYFTSTSGFNLSYKGEFSNIFHNWNFGVEGLYTSPTFAINFFGFGNDTPDEGDEDLDFNRVRIRQWNAAISLNWKGRDGGYFQFKPLIESFEVQRTANRFIATAASGIDANDNVFDRQNYVGAEVTYGFENKNDAAFPTYGLNLGLTVGYKTDIEDETVDNNFGYIRPVVSFEHKINKSGSLVYATKVGGQVLIGDDFEFYHASQLGGNKSLRGFRNERFTGKHSFYQNTDLRLKLGTFKSSFIPLKYGITGGFDYGRVWLDGDDFGDLGDLNTSAGASFWVSGLDTFASNLGIYGSDDGLRIVFVFGFAF